MAPSRGLLPLLRTHIPIFNPKFRRYSHFAATATDSSQKARVFVSKSQDPYLNLSIEHYLLQKSPADSTILFLYANSPCVVIGRNQNPWVEVNLGVLRNEELGVKLVRRRSGGGTVFHDEGNVNYCVICPTPAFDRDKHAEMVVKALKYLGTEKARVNERHDIVVDKEDKDTISKTFKVSGSAYKITRLRSLHHGTCLLSSPNLESISKYLRAPGKPFIKARGVDSVSSPVANVGISNSEFMKAVAFEFESMYPEADPSRRFTVFGNEKEIPEIAKGVEELMSDDWIYCQTPQFTFSSENAALSVIGQPTKSSSPSMWSGFKTEFTAKHGKIVEVSIDYSGHGVDGEELEASLLNKELHQISDWEHILPSFVANDGERRVTLSPGRELNRLFGGGSYEPSNYNGT